jgi:hypothetical protein
MDAGAAERNGWSFAAGPEGVESDTDGKALL